MGEFLTIQPGSFQMGSPDGEVGRWDDELGHAVTLTRSFVMLSIEVTQGQFDSLMGYNPSEFSTCGTNCPVESVNWYEAAAYCNALSAADGFVACYTCTGAGVDVSCDLAAAYATPYDCPGYRLPTAAEWEYAARADTVTATYSGDLDDEHLECEQPNDALDSIAWFCGNSGDTTHVVGTRDPNAWGLFDTLGNVWEWCHDWRGEYPPGSVTDPWGVPAGDFRQFRGGSWFNVARDVRSGNRNGGVPGLRFIYVGFRPVRSLP